jgi:hypothetical protein
MRAAIIYWSQTGNTEKVARAIHEGLTGAGADVEFTRVEDAADLDVYAYDLLCVGFPSYQWRPPKPVGRYLDRRFNHYKREGRVKIGAPAVPGKHVLIFCTYSGPHTGIREAIPAGKVAGQYFEHLGLPVIDEWYVVGEFHGREEASTQGRLGDIRGRPNANDLARVRADAAQLARRLMEEALDIDPRT